MPHFLDSTHASCGPPSHWMGCRPLLHTALIDRNVHDAIDTAASGFDTRKEVQGRRLYSIGAARPLPGSPDNIPYIPKPHPNSPLRRVDFSSYGQAGEGKKGTLQTLLRRMTQPTFPLPCPLPHSQENRRMKIKKAMPSPCPSVLKKQRECFDRCIQ